MNVWTRLDLATCDHPPSHLTADDVCWFRREYLVDHASDKKPWQLGETNLLIMNLKADLRKGAWLRDKKMAAIEQFAEELAYNVKAPRAFAATPCSAHRDDPAFDDRLELVLQRAQQKNPLIVIVSPVVRTRSIEKTHRRGGARHPDDQRDTLAFRGFEHVLPGNTLFLIDDVITSGSTFKACQQAITADRPGTQVNGVFWARRKVIDAPQPTIDWKAFFDLSP